MSDAAITTVVSGVITVVTLVIGFATLYVKLKYGDKETKIVQDKIDHNTNITKVSASAAVTAAGAAAVTAASTKSAVDGMSKKLNGGIDLAIQEAVKPLHDRTDEQGHKIEELTLYVHDRNHDILTALQVQATKLETVVQMVKKIGGGQ